MNTDALPPQDAELEKNVLGSMLCSDGGEHIGFEQLAPDDFYGMLHRQIFEVICDLVRGGKPVDILSVKTGCEEKPGLHFIEKHEILTALTGMMNTVASSVNIEYHIENLKKLAFRRLTIKHSMELKAAALDPTHELSELNAIAQGHLTDIVQGRVGKGFQHVSDPMKEVLDELEKRVKPERLETGFWDIDQLKGLFRPGSYNILAGLPGTGKTSLCLNFTLHQLEMDNPVAFMSLDDSATNTIRRLISIAAEEELTEDGEKTENLCETAFRVGAYPLYIESTIQNIDDLCANCRLVHARFKPKLYIIDYLQLVFTEGNEDDVQRISRVSSQLRALSKQLNACFIVTSQFSREAAKDRVRPRIHHLKGSSQIEQDADSIIIMHRKDSEQGEDWNKTVNIDMYVDKNKNGPIKEFKLDFQMDIFKFRTPHHSNQWKG